MSNWYKYIWSSLCMIFVLPVVAILSVTNQIECKGWNDGAWEFIVVKDSWLYKKYVNRYNGASFGWCIFYLEECDFNNLVTRMHERIHLEQQLWLSIFQWIFYGLFWVVITLFTQLDGYSANPFEIDARLRAGQLVGDLGRKKK